MLLCSPTCFQMRYLKLGTYLSTGNTLLVSLNLLTAKGGKKKDIKSKDVSYSLANVLKLFKPLGMNREAVSQVIKINMLFGFIFKLN